MITVNRINGKDIIVNAELIEFIETTPDTIITTTTGKKLFVKNSPQEVIDKVIEYRRKIFPYKEMLMGKDEDIKEVENKKN